MQITQRDRVPTKTAYNFQGLLPFLHFLAHPLPQEHGEYMGIKKSKTLPYWLGTPKDCPLGPAVSCRFKRKLCFQELTPCPPFCAFIGGRGWVGASLNH